MTTPNSPSSTRADVEAGPEADAVAHGTPSSAGSRVVAALSWVIAVWALYVFLVSLPYKFTLHPDTQHIFGTIGAWMSGLLGEGIGGLFTDVGSYAVGAFELITSIVLLAPLPAWLAKLATGREPARSRAFWHRLGGSMAALVMAGAVFFHLATPLGIVVLHQGESDGGRLFFSAVSILVGGIVLAVANHRVLRRDRGARPA